MCLTEGEDVQLSIVMVEQDANVNVSLLFLLFVPSLGFYSRSVVFTVLV